MTRQTSLPALFARITSKYSIYLILLAMLVICSLLSDAFFSAKNLSNISRQISITTIISFGMTMLIIAGMIDLAAGSVISEPSSGTAASPSQAPASGAASRPARADSTATVRITASRIGREPAITITTKTNSGSV